MQWDLGIQGLALLGALSLGFGVVAGLLAGGGLVRRLWTVAVTAVACSGVGLFTSEVWFGWATEEELQPNIDGLSYDEVFLSAVVTSVLVVLVTRHLARRPERRATTGPTHVAGRHR